MKYIMVATFLTLSCFAEPELKDPVKASVPFVDDQFNGLSEHDSGYSLKVEKDKSGCVLTLLKNAAVIDSIVMSGNIAVHTIKWTNNSAWFLLRERINFGSIVIAIVHCDLHKKEKGFTMYHCGVRKEGDENGRIFDITSITDTGVRLICSFKNSNSRKINFFEGTVKMSDMEVYSREDFTKDHSKPSTSGTERNVPLKRSAE